MLRTSYGQPRRILDRRMGAGARNVLSAVILALASLPMRSLDNENFLDQIHKLGQWKGFADVTGDLGSVGRERKHIRTISAGENDLYIRPDPAGIHQNLEARGAGDGQVK